MEPSQVKEMIGLLSERNSAWQTLWTTFYTISVAIVTLIASGKLGEEYRWLASAIATAGFSLFAAGNFASLNNLRRQREALIRYVVEKSGNDGHIRSIAEAAAPPTYDALRVYHWGLCVFVVLLVWVIPALQK